VPGDASRPSTGRSTPAVVASAGFFNTEKREGHEGPLRKQALPMDRAGGSFLSGMPTRFRLRRRDADYLTIGDRLASLWPSFVLRVEMEEE
jgi:hypothetical protein